MPERHDDNDGSNIFWPGYVDATTNLALNLLFLLTIMITAVFMFALEMGRSSVDIPKNPHQQEVNTASNSKDDHIEQIVTLKLEIQRLNKMLAQQELQDVNPGGLEKTYDATSSEPKPLQGLDQTHASDFEIVVRFKDEAIALTPDERARLLESLQPVVSKGKSNIYVEVPAGFSEAKRMGFYRAMAVRNLLIEMNVPKEKIDVSVVEGKGDANSSLVMVR
jgi:hypothetical protein